MFTTLSLRAQYSLRALIQRTGLSEIDFEVFHTTTVMPYDPSLLSVITDEAIRLTVSAHLRQRKQAHVLSLVEYYQHLDNMCDDEQVSEPPMSF